MQKHFDTFTNGLITDDKFGVIKPTPDNNITLYLFPLCKHSEFASKFLELSQIEDKKALGVLGIIKRQMSLRRNFLNPVLIKEAS